MVKPNTWFYLTNHLIHKNYGFLSIKEHNTDLNM